MADLPLVAQLNCEVRYNAGFLYYDRSGMVMRALLEALGSPPFTGGAPTPGRSVLSGLSSPAERLSLEYGPEMFRLTQVGLETLARAEQVAPPAWEIVSDKLEVKRSVTRIGVRIHLMWPAESEDEAESRLLKSGLLNETDRWAQMFGTPTKRAYTSIVGTKGSDQGRLVLSGGRFVIEGGEPPPSLARFQMPVAIVFDADWYRESDPANSLPKQALKDFLRDSWTKSKELGQKLAELL